MRGIHTSFLLLLATTLLLHSCQNKPTSAPEIIDATIEKAGGERWKKSIIQFDFRDQSFSIRRDGGLFEYSRTSYPAPDTVMKDVLQNYGFKRTINDTMVSLTDNEAAKFKSSLNATVYFFSLPYGLNDRAVNKALMPPVELDGTMYHKIKVWFDEDGGGEDFEDQYLFWIHPDSMTIDYFAYSYESGGGGMRFRKSINPRYINGIRVSDYINYKPSTTDIDFYNIDGLYSRGKLEEISIIENENVSVSIITE